MWIVALLIMASAGYAIRGVWAVVFVCAVFAIVLFFAWLASRREVTLPPDTGPSLPRIDSYLPHGWRAAGARFTGGGASGDW